MCLFGEERIQLICIKTIEAFVTSQKRKIKIIITEANWAIA